MRELYAIATHDLCHGKFPALLNGQLLVSRAGVQTQPRAVYAMLRRHLHDPPGHWLHKSAALMPATYRERHGDVAEDTNNDPLFSHELERMWAVLFGCTRVDHVVDGACSDPPIDVQH